MHSQKRDSKLNVLELTFSSIINFFPYCLISNLSFLTFNSILFNYNFKSSSTHIKVLYNGFFPRCKFPKCYTLIFSRNYPIKKFMSPTTETSHMRDILYKVYMGKTIINHTLTMSTVIMVLYSCMVTTCTCICTTESKNSRSFTAYVHKECGLVWQDLFWCSPFITCSIRTQPCHSPWLYMLVCHSQTLSA